MVFELQQLRVIMHVDLDYFFAQVEEREDHAIVGRPVIVCVYSGRGGDSGVVSTANYIARKYGVGSGISIALAKKKLKSVEAVFLSVNHQLYSMVSKKIMCIIRKYGDAFEQASIDEAYLDVTDRSGRDFERGRDLAIEIQKDILTTEEITCSIGIAPSKLVAKIAAGIHKPNGITLVRPEAVETFLSPIPVRELVGVGAKTEKTLHNLGVRTIGELANLDLGRLVKTFGKKLGTYFADAALGIDHSRVEERGKAESISRMSTLKENTRDSEAIVGELNRLAEDLHSSTVKDGLSFRGITVVAVMDDLKAHTRSKTLDKSSRDLTIVKQVAGSLLENLLAEETNHQVRRIGMKIFDFAKHEGQKQLTDFTL